MGGGGGGAGGSSEFFISMFRLLSFFSSLSFFSQSVCTFLFSSALVVVVVVLNVFSVSVDPGTTSLSQAGFPYRFPLRQLFLLPRSSLFSLFIYLFIACFFPLSLPSGLCTTQLSLQPFLSPDIQITFVSRSDRRCLRA